MLRLGLWMTMRFIAISMAISMVWSSLLSLLMVLKSSILQIDKAYLSER